jgi:hypothetical protein
MRRAIRPAGRKPISQAAEKGEQASFLSRDSSVTKKLREDLNALPDSSWFGVRFLEVHSARNLLAQAERFDRNQKRSISG